jgi:excisionase family DNA binding protein
MNNQGPSRHRVTANAPRQRLISLREAALYLGRTEEALRMMVRRNQVPGVVRIGRKTQFDRRKLDAWIANRTDQEEPPL